MASLLLVASCTGQAAPEVSVHIRVGDADSAEERWGTAREILDAIQEDPLDTRPRVTATSATTFKVEAPASPEDLERAVQALRTCDPDDVLLVTHTVAAAGPGAWPALRAALLEPRKASKTEYRRVLTLIGGDVPNRYGYFELTWKKAHGYQVKLSENWLEDLLALAPSRISKAARPIYRDLLVTTALLSAASRLAHEHPELAKDAVATLLDAAYTHDSTFRDEVGRALAVAGDEAVPWLLFESEPPPTASKSEDDPAVRRAEYARLALDRMDRLQPHRTLAMLGDRPQLLVRTIEGYGVARTPEAPAELVARLDHEIPAVRNAARAALRNYVEGPGPSSEKKALRLVGGGTAQGSQLSWRDVAGREIRSALEGIAPNSVEATCSLYQKDGSRDRECAAQPLRHYELLIAALDARRADAESSVIARAGMEIDRNRAVALLDDLLAAEGGKQHAQTISAIYVRAAEQAAAHGDQARVAQLLRKSAMLRASQAPDVAAKMRARALTYEADAPDLDVHGREMLLKLARELDPQDARVQASAIEHADSDARKMSHGWRLIGLAAALAVVGLSGIAALGSWLHRAPRRA